MLVVRQSRQGFTLIEILIAIALVVVMGSIAIPGFLSYLERGKRKAAAAQVRVLKSSIDQYYADVGSFPETLTDLIKRPQDPEIAAKWEMPYLEAKTVPKDPWGTPYQYHKTPDAENNYELYSYGSSKGKSTPKEQRIDAWK